MFEIFVSTFVIYFVVVDPIGTAPVFITITENLSRNLRIKVALEGSFFAFLIMLFFAFFGMLLLTYLGISLNAFKIGGGIILLGIALEMLSSRRQDRKKSEIDRQMEGYPKSDASNLAIYPLAMPLLAGPACITSIMIVSADYGDSYSMLITAYSALAAVMIVTALILGIVAVGHSYIDERITSIISRVTAIILAALAVQYIIDGIRSASVF